MSGEWRQLLPDQDAAIQAGAEHIARSLAEAVRDRGVAHWATTGGSTAPGLYRALAAPPLRDAVPWSQVHVWWGDDRFVTREHPQSNVKPLDDILMEIGSASAGSTGKPSGVGIPIANLHPFRTAEAIGAGRDPASVARLLATELADLDLELRDGFPVLDLVILGMGPDGHCLSVFPGSPAFDATDWALAIPAPTHIEPHVARVTMHPSIVTVARDVLMVVTGAGKAEMLARVLGEEIDVRRWPAQVARHERATWILDEAAAAQLPG